jgi:hypothetical protein
MRIEPRRQKTSVRVPCEELIGEPGGREFAGYYTGMRNTIDQGSPTEKLAAEPELVARLNIDCIESASPKARYRVGNFTVKLAPYMLLFMPSSLMGKLTKMALGIR